MKKYTLLTKNNIKNKVEEELLAINSIVEAAIEHGGDLGGPYYSEPGQLKIELNSYLEVKGLTGLYEVKFISGYGDQYTLLYDSDKDDDGHFAIIVRVESN